MKTRYMDKPVIIHLTVLSFSDIDECSTNPCPANSICRNSIGSYTCDCNYGYVCDVNTCVGKEIIFVGVRVMCLMPLFIGGGNKSTQRKPSTWHKSLTNFIT